MNRTHYHTHIDQCDWPDWQWDSWDIETGEALAAGGAALDDATRREGVPAADISLPPGRTRRGGLETQAAPLLAASH